MDEVTKMLVEAFTRQLVSIGIGKTIEVLREFATDINPKAKSSEEDGVEVELPTAGIIGIGRCGTHIALDLARTIHKARESLSQTVDANPTQVVPTPVEKKAAWWDLASWTSEHAASAREGGQLLLIDPVILAADLDGNVQGTIKSSARLSGRGENQIRFALTDLTWLQKGGAGNVPIVAQYLATLALLVPADQLPDAALSWQHHRSYFIESAGLHDNTSRLFIFLFSCGGGSGSGMASVLGTAQQNAMIQNILGRPRAGTPDETAAQFTAAEPICSLGIGILPEVTDTPSAQHLNAGRLFCRYLAQQNRFDLDKTDDPEEGSRPDITRRMFNCLLLVSNWIMVTSFGTEKEEGNTSLSTAERMANHYIGQQIFNLLAAQAMISDYEDDYQRGNRILDEAGITDTIRLDANDLSNSLMGPTAVAYAEGFSSGSQTLIDLFHRAIALPNFRKEESLVEGISLLPTRPERYKPILDKAQAGDYKELAAHSFFRFAFSIVAIISVPNLETLQTQQVLALRDALEQCFPSAKIRRYAVVQGSSKNPSLTLFIVGTACSTFETFNHLLRYVQGCFLPENVPTDHLDKLVSQILSADTFNPEPLREILFPVESLDRTIVGISGSLGQWKMNKLTYEQRFASYLPSHDDQESLTPSMQIDSLRVTADEVINTLEYIYRVEHQSGPHRGFSDRY